LVDLRVAIVTAHFSTLHSSNEYDLARGLSKSGIKTTLVTSDRTSRLSKGLKLQAKSVEEQQTREFEVIRLRTTIDAFGTPLMPALQSCVSKLDIDLVHSQEYFRTHSMQSFRASRAGHIPFVFTQHRYFQPRGVLGLLFSVGCNTIWRRVVMDAAGITAVTRAARDYLLSKFPLSAESVHVIPHPVDASRFGVGTEGNWFRDELQLGTGPVILSVGRLIPVKRFDRLIVAFSHVREAVPTASLVIIGSGSQEAYLRNLIEALGLREAVKIVTRYVDYWTEMPLVYSSADIFVLSSSQDVLPISMLEAMSSGLPIIATKVGGIPDFVLDGVNGYLSDPSDKKAFAQRLSEVAADTSLAKRLGRNARDKVSSSADMMLVARKTIEVYKEALNATQGTS
jgi:glycosyltransferase involved in cell wall biosynthesis